MTAKRFTRRQKRQQAVETESVVNKKFNMKRIQPMTDTQKELFLSYKSGKNIANIGSAGTGKHMFLCILLLKKF